MDDKQKKAIKTNDWLVVGSFVLMLAVKFATLFIFSMIHQETKADIDAITTAYEGNDLFKIAISFQKIGQVVGIIILPAAALATYFYYRRKVLAQRMELTDLSFFVQFVFFTLLINITNDGAVLLGKLAQGGIL